MVCKINSKGFSLIELLVVIAILGIVVGIGAFNSRDAMRTYRVKTAVSDTRVILNYAKTVASRENSLVFVQLKKEGENYNFDVFLDNRDGVFNNATDEFLRRLTIGYSSLDPGSPSNNIQYSYDKYSTLSLEGALDLGDTIGTGEDASGNVTAYSTVNFTDDLLITVEQTGFMDFGQSYISFQYRNSGDIDENLGDRKYALLIAKTGSIESYRYDNVNLIWEKY